MQSFAYANPATIQEAVAQLSAKWGDADVLAGGTDLITLMKEHLHTPKRVVNIKNIDRKSTRLNSSHLGISYAVFCLKKKNKKIHRQNVNQTKTALPGSSLYTWRT